MLLVLVLAASLAMCHGGALHRAQGIGKPQECAGRWVARLNRSGGRLDPPIPTLATLFGTLRNLFLTSPLLAPTPCAAGHPRSHCKNLERLDLTDLLGQGLSSEELQANALVQPQVIVCPASTHR